MDGSGQEEPARRLKKTHRHRLWMRRLSPRGDQGGKILWIGSALLLLLAGFDLSRSPDRQWATRALVGAIDLYQATLSPLMPTMGVQCRFEPTCSHYGEASIRKYGAVSGTARTVWRILRCGPWTEAGTADPP